MKRPCPSEEILVDYLECRLSHDERLEIEEHLSGCEICLNEFAVAGNVIRRGDRSGLAPVPPQVVDAAVSLVNGCHGMPYGPLGERIRDAVNGVRQRLFACFPLISPARWHLSPVRGEERTIPGDIVKILRSFNGVKAEIEIENTGYNKAHIRISLPEGDRQEKGIRATLRRSDRDIISSLMNEDYTLFEDIPFGHYNLVFSRGGERLGAYPFEIKESCNGGK
ncbi:MAG: zf-HC2 domain-containing protein [Desulfobacteraceae bacterium]|nr:zf-HC2 domain-containing protein [Desulfobacteraceae bacterium]